MIKKLSCLLGLGLLLSATTSEAHQFWPDSYDVMRPGNASAMVMVHLKSDVDAYYQFTIFGGKDRNNAKQLGGKQLLFADQNTDFPIVVPKSILKNDTFTICSLQVAKKETMQKEVCLRFNVL